MSSDAITETKTVSEKLTLLEQQNIFVDMGLRSGDDKD